MIRPVQSDLFAVIGNPVRHSLSPVMMNAAFQGLQIPAVYVSLEVDDPKEDLETIRKLGFLGLSVTIPHKEAACRLAVQIDATARIIGAVNTLKRTEEGWEGRNTDWIGATRALMEAGGMEGRRALVLGAGGAARAVVFGLLEKKCHVTISNRSMERGKALADYFKCHFVPLAVLGIPGAGNNFDVIVQCTPVGLMGAGDGASLLSESFFHAGMLVMDTVYRPLWTPMLNAAKRAGATAVTGLDMLLHQGVAQLEWWFGRPIPEAGGISVMRDALMKAVAYDQKN